MQNKPQPGRRSIWPVFAALLLIVIAGIAVWRFWPREYSPADPRGYGALEDIPFENGNSNILLKAPFRWDYEVLMKYGILHTQAPFNSAYGDDDFWRTWNNCYVLDFLERVATNEPAVIRETYRPGDHVCELRYVPQAGCFFLTTNHICCDEQCRVYGITKNNKIVFAYRDMTNGTPSWYTFQVSGQYTEGDGFFYVQYHFGYDPEQDVLVKTLVKDLESRMLCINVSDLEKDMAAVPDLFTR